jgi:Zn-dependent protease with chaperone function
VNFIFYGDDGSGLPLNFGSGSGTSNQLLIDVPGNGSRIIQTYGSSKNTVQGWATALSDSPIVATISFRATQNGNPLTEISAPSALPTPIYRSSASASLGVAIANVFSNTTTNANVDFYDAEGHQAGHTSVSLPPLGHIAFTLGDRIPGLGVTTGSIVISGAAVQDRFVAWTLNYDGGTFSTLPSGEADLPVAQWERTWLVFERVFAAARQMNQFGTDPVVLNVSADPVINAFAQGTNSVTIYLALSELISDSTSELAFAVAHELGHIYQNRLGKLPYVPDNAESDADAFGMIVMMAAGYDPYAGAGTLGKLSMASGQAGLLTQFEDQIGSDAHQSFNTRLDNLFTLMKLVCAQVPSVCAAYKSGYHSHLPGIAPLSKPPLNLVNR